VTREIDYRTGTPIRKTKGYLQCKLTQRTQLKKQNVLLPRSRTKAFNMTFVTSKKKKSKKEILKKDPRMTKK